MISQFFVLSPRGDVIIRRDYLGNVPKVGRALDAAAGVSALLALLMIAWGAARRPARRSSSATPSFSRAATRRRPCSSLMASHTSTSRCGSHGSVILHVHGRPGAGAGKQLQAGGAAKPGAQRARAHAHALRRVHVHVCSAAPWSRARGLGGSSAAAHAAALAHP